jgi:hypothetical protein
VVAEVEVVDSQYLILLLHHHQKEALGLTAPQDLLIFIIMMEAALNGFSYLELQDHKDQ